MAPTVEPWERFTILPYTKEGESWQWNCHWPKALTRLPPQSPRPATATITSKLIATKKSWSVSSFETSFDPACLKACAVGLDISRPGRACDLLQWPCPAIPSFEIWSRLLPLPLPLGPLDPLFKFPVEFTFWFIYSIALSIFVVSFCWVPSLLEELQGLLLPARGD